MRHRFQKTEKATRKHHQMARNASKDVVDSFFRFMIKIGIRLCHFFMVKNNAKVTAAVMKIFIIKRLKIFN